MYNFSKLLDELDEESDYITEESFYPPEDDRCVKSYIEDIDGGDNFIDYCEYIFDYLEEQGYYE